jgi:hypothetical protein
MGMMGFETGVMALAGGFDIRDRASRYLYENRELLLVYFNCVTSVI